MAIGKGKTSCQDERDICYFGFNDLITLLIKNQKEEEKTAKENLLNIQTDYTLSIEEKRCESVPYTKILEEIEERYIRMRRCIFIGLYSYWDNSLKEVLEFYGVNKVKIKNNNKSKKNKITGLLTRICGKVSDEIEILTGNIRELRNFFVHGTITEARKKNIEDLVQNHSEFNIKGSQNFYYISDSNGLLYLSKLIYKELYNIEYNYLNIKKNKL